MRGWVLVSFGPSKQYPLPILTDPRGLFFERSRSGQMETRVLILAIFLACSMRFENIFDGWLMSEPRMPITRSIVHWAEREGGPTRSVSGPRWVSE